MIRIVGGEYKGFRINAPKTEATRPISDQAKEALFNMFGDIEGLSFLDAYAGSGSVGLEAISRGAYPVIFVDSATIATEAIAANARHLGVEDMVEIEKQPVATWLLSAQGETFDIVFADPPFEETEQAPLPALAAKATRLFIYKHKRRGEAMELPNMELLRSRRYGDSRISIYAPSKEDTNSKL